MKKSTKQGAASFYIVSFATLLLTIIVVGFTAIVVSNIKRTSNNDLANSAYDSAMAGIEDAKIALLNYQSCINQGYTETAPSGGSTLTCGEIIYYMNHLDCDMVAHALSRIGKNEHREVLIEETEENSNNNNGANEMSQAYTCVKVTETTNDYRARIDKTQPSQLIPLQTAAVENIKSVRISWFSDTDSTTYNYQNSLPNDFGFGSALKEPLATPPSISVQLIQTSKVFYLSDLDVTQNNQTDRGTLFFVASERRTTSSHQAKKSNGEATTVLDNRHEASYLDITNDNYLSATEGFLKSNDKTSKNIPNLVYCPKNSGKEYACSVALDLPEPVNGNRNDSTFYLTLSLLYGAPDTEFKIELCTATHCNEQPYDAANPLNDKITFSNVQIIIDSTGRANNLYRRIETRLDSNDVYYAYSAGYALQTTGSGDTIIKDLSVPVEHTPQFR